tara:strand:- start:1297 stop:1971 length:675 start_codon:yes stop_codon:yes gene_type:complete
MKEISIIIPSLNEEKQIKKCLNSLNHKIIREKCEIILVDGKSSDQTINKARGLVDKCLITSPDRSNQLMMGASVANGSVLVFLHADTILSYKNISDILSKNDNFKWGFFNLSFDIMSNRYKWLSYMINLRSRIFNICTGDQCMVISKYIFDEIGGYPNIRLMEDLRISKNLKKVHQPHIFKTSIETSSRRWRTHGFLLTILKMHFLRFLYYLGIETKTLRELYK